MPGIDIFINATDKASPALNAVRGSVAGVGSAARNTSSGISAMGVALGTMMGNLASSALTKLSDMARNVVATGLQFDNMGQQAQIAFSTMLGSGEAAESFLNRLKDFAAKTPFEFPDLLTASQRMLAMGFQSDKVLPTLTAIGDAVAGLGGSSAMVDRVTTALGQMQAKGKASGEEMMQLTEAGIPAWEFLAKAIGVSTADAMKKVTEGAISSDVAITALVDGMNNKFGGLMTQQSATFGGLYSTIKDTFAQVSGKVMGPLFERLTEGFAAIVDWTTRPEFTAGVEKLTAWIDRAMSAMIAWARAALPSVREGLARVWIIAQDVWNVLQQLWGALKTTWATVKEAVAPIAEAVASWVKWKDVLIAAGIVIASIVVPALVSIVAAAAPVIAVAAALVAGVALLRNAWEKDWGGIREIVYGAVEYLKKIFGGLGADIARFGGNALKEIGRWVTGQETDFHNVNKIWESAKKAFGELFADMGAKLKQFAEYLVQQLREQFPKTAKFFTDTVEGIRKLWDENWGNVRTTVESVLRTVGGYLAKYLPSWQGDWKSTLEYFTGGEAIRHWINLFKYDIPTIVFHMIEDTKFFFTSWYDYLKNKLNDFKNDTIFKWQVFVADIVAQWEHWVGEGKRIFGKIEDFFTVTWGNVKRNTQLVWKEIVDWTTKKWDEWFGWFKPGEWYDMGHDLLDGLWRGMKSIWTTVSTWTTGIWNQLKNGFNQLFDRHSPSGWFEQGGADLMKGLQNGLSSGVGGVIATFDSLTSGIITRANALGIALDGSLAEIAGKITALGNYSAALANVQNIGANQAANYVLPSNNTLGNIGLPVSLQGRTPIGINATTGQPMYGDAWGRSADDIALGNMIGTGNKDQIDAFRRVMDGLFEKAATLGQKVYSFIDDIGSSRGYGAVSGLTDAPTQQNIHDLSTGQNLGYSDLPRAIFALIDELKQTGVPNAAKNTFNLTVAPTATGDLGRDAYSLFGYLTSLYGAAA